jgi:NitT/TauT family transport system substrate-binding protein
LAEYGLDVEILDPAPGPENVRRVANGGADFCLTSVTHYLRARAQSGALVARFVAVVVQRSPMAGIVVADSPLTSPADLAGKRVGGPPDSALVAEYRAGLSSLGLAPPTVVPVDYGLAPAALGRREIDAVPDFADLVPRTRRQAGVPVRAVPLGVEVYASGLVAADRVPDNLVASMRVALTESLLRQRANPTAGLDELRARYPEVDPADAVEGWRLVEPNIFTGVEPGSMEAERWRHTIAWTAAAHGVVAPPPETVYRPELALAPTGP